MLDQNIAAAAAAAKSLQSCPTLQPHRQKPTRLPCPWDSPGKNTGVGCHFLLQGMKVKSESEVAQSCLTLGDPMDCSLAGSTLCQVPVTWKALQQRCEMGILILKFHIRKLRLRRLFTQGCTAWKQWNPSSHGSNSF